MGGKEKRDVKPLLNFTERARVVNYEDVRDQLGAEKRETRKRC